LNPVAINPASTGGRGALNIFTSYGKQWVGLDGSPANLTVSLDAPFANQQLVIFFIERIAGGDHYMNFRRFNALGGPDYLIEKKGLRIESHKLRKKSAFRVVVCR